MNNRDLELLSAYLDGQLSPNESARLESRVAADPELFAALADLRAARSILRKLPKRKSPRNFTLTRKMVGLNPPLPRSYAFFQYATVFASILLALTFATNLLAPRLNYVGPINTGWGGGGGIGGGYGGGGPAIQQSAPSAAEAPATQAPAATEAPAMPQAAAATQAPPAADLAPLPTATAELARVSPTAEATMEKSAGAENSAQPNQPPVEGPALIPIGWQIAFLVIVIIGAMVTYALRQSAKQKWQ